MTLKKLMIPILMMSVTKCSKIAEVLQQFTSEMLIIARYGGEEFLLCFDSTTKDQVMKTCKTILQEIEALDFTHIDTNIKVTVSMGVVNATDESLHRNLIQTADNNLYIAKASGKNQIIYSD